MHLFDTLTKWKLTVCRVTTGVCITLYQSIRPTEVLPTSATHGKDRGHSQGWLLVFCVANFLPIVK